MLMSSVMACGAAYAGQDPISWQVSGSFPNPVVSAGGIHEITYTLRNELPLTLLLPLQVQPIGSPSAEFIYEDLCSGRYLLSHESCTVRVFLEPLDPGLKTFQLTVGVDGNYDRNRVSLPKLSTQAIT